MTGPDAATGATGPAPRSATPRPEAPRPASPWRRLMCVVYEGILLFGVIFFVGYGYSALTSFHGDPGPLRNGLQVVALAALGWYFIGFWSGGRRSLPMKTMLVHLEGPDGAPPSLARAAVRFAVAVVLVFGPFAAMHAWGPAGALLWLPLVLVPLLDRQHRALYDIAAGTRLLRDAPGGARGGAAATRRAA